MSQKRLTIFNRIFEIWAVQRIAKLVDLEKCFPMSIWLQRLASIQKRTSLSKFAKNPPKVRKKVRINIHGGRGRATPKEWIEKWIESPPKLWEARSLLYRSQILQPNTHWKAFFEIYKFCNPLHRSDLKNSVKIRPNFCEIEYWIFNRNFSSFP